MPFENDVEQDVTADSSPELETNQQQLADSSSAVSNEPAPVAQPKQEEPFHTHPRFKELISEKNELREQLKAFQSQMEALKGQIPKPAQPKDELMERLKGIDPAFAERFGKINEVDALKQELADFKSWREQQAAQTVAQSVQSEKEKFYSENKVPAQHRKLYEAQIMLAAQADPSLKASDLPKVMKSIHDEMSQLFTSTQREATKQLVEGKKAEAAKPATQPKGVPATANQKQAPLSKADMRAQLVKEILAESKAAKDI